jgi:hypothetical protein|tara:strand:+ start:276 stop:542 length:267 start_codon:yes stop_codon:yes gene_type:complete
MKKLQFNNLDLILDWIKNPEHKDSLFLLECAINDAKKKSFSIGDKVSFGRPNGRKHIGIVEKINISKAVVNCNGSKWRVPFSMIKEAA